MMLVNRSPRFASLLADSSEPPKRSDVTCGQKSSSPDAKSPASNGSSPSHRFVHRYRLGHSLPKRKRLYDSTWNYVLRWPATLNDKRFLLIVALVSVSYFLSAQKLLYCSFLNPAPPSTSISRLANVAVANPNRAKGTSRPAVKIQLEPTPRPFQLPDQSLPDYGRRHFGGLEIKFPPRGVKSRFARQIYHDFNDEKGYDELYEEADDDGDIGYYYAFDDDEKRNPLTMWDDPDIHLRKKCRRTSWHRQLPINCNGMHEFDFLNHIRLGESKYLGGGYYRDVYLTKLPNDKDVVFKHFYWGNKYEYDGFEYMRMDALVNEKLNGNPRIVKSYGFCAMSIIGEAMVNGDLEKVAIESGKPRITKPLDDQDHLVLGNSLSGTEKLEMSLQMAEAVRVLHSYPGGVIVHDDIQLPQFLFSSNGQLKLNDFNRAEIMLWNEKDQEYCRYKNEPGHGDWRAPEEYHDDPLDEKIDVWSLGMNMYALLTGLYPFYEMKEREVKNLVKKGEVPYIDPRYKERSFAEAKLVDIMQRCWTYERQKRIDIFKLVSLLQDAVKENRQRQATKDKKKPLRRA